jgi:hypothetical protein
MYVLDAGVLCVSHADVSQRPLAVGANTHRVRLIGYRGGVIELNVMNVMKLVFAGHFN